MLTPEQIESILLKAGTTGVRQVWFTRPEAKKIAKLVQELYQPQETSALDDAVLINREACTEHPDDIEARIHFGQGARWAIKTFSAPKSEEIQRLKENIKKLQILAFACYAGLGGECNLPENWLDALHAAANGEPFETESLLPFTYVPPSNKKQKMDYVVRSLRSIANLGREKLGDSYPEIVGLWAIMRDLTGEEEWVGEAATMVDNPATVEDVKKPGWKLHRCPDGEQCRDTIGGGCAAGWCSHFKVEPDEEGVPRYPLDRSKEVPNG